MCRQQTCRYGRSVVLLRWKCCPLIIRHLRSAQVSSPSRAEHQQEKWDVRSHPNSRCACFPPSFSLLIHLGEQLVWIQSCEPQIKTDIWWGQVCLFHPACKYAKLSNFPKYKNLLPEKERVLSLSIKSRLYVCRFSFACSVCCCNSSPVIFSLSYLFGCHL